ncbi:MAG: hypothetical protein ACKVH8_06320 [Pirellulales bacterium]|jgi:hypothetical protein
MFSCKHAAAAHADPEIVAVLIKNNADVNASGYWPLEETGE